MVLKKLDFSRTSRVHDPLPGRHRWRHRLAAALAPLLLLAPPAAASPSLRAAPPVPASRPALWVVNDQDTIIYLFGTFHALDDRTAWFGHSIKAAFDASDELVLETIVPDNPRRLKATLGPAPMTTGGDGQAIFAKTVDQTMATGRRIGMTVDKGADAVLKLAAERSGKPVEGLEKFEEQLAMFRSLSAGRPGSQAGPAAAPPPGAIAQVLLQMQDAWHRGDASGVALMLANIEAKSPSAYQRLFADRNANWARWIAERLDKPGVVFVAVGTGHLIGRDSVQNKLALQGINSARVS